MFLLPGFEVVCRMHEDQEEADACRYEAEDGAYEETDMVEGEAPV